MENVKLTEATEVQDCEKGVGSARVKGRSARRDEAHRVQGTVGWSGSFSVRGEGLRVSLFMHPGEAEAKKDTHHTALEHAEEETSSEEARVGRDETGEACEAKSALSGLIGKAEPAGTHSR